MWFFSVITYDLELQNFITYVRGYLPCLRRVHHYQSLYLPWFGFQYTLFCCRQFNEQLYFWAKLDVIKQKMPFSITKLFLSFPFLYNLHNRDSQIFTILITWKQNYEKFASTLSSNRKKKSKNVVYQYIWRLLWYTNVNPLLPLCPHASHRKYGSYFHVLTSIVFRILMNIKKFVIMPLVINICNNLLKQFWDWT